MMRNIYIILAACLLMVVYSCDDYLQEVNTNPNQKKELDPEYFFSTAVFGTVGGPNVALQFPFGYQYGHYYVGNNLTRFVDIYEDGFTETFYADAFNKLYSDPIRHIKEVILLTSEDGKYANSTRYSMAKIIEAYNYIRLADAYGAVPFTEGGYGQEEILYPAYDQVSDIYMDVLNTLSASIETLENSDVENGFSEADPLYENNLDQWGAFANSLRFRLAMRLRRAEPQLAEELITECMSKPLIETNGDNAMFQYSEDSRDFNNPINFPVGVYHDVRPSEMLVETLKSYNDPRLDIFCRPKNGEFIGVTNGLSDEELGKVDYSIIASLTDTLIGKAAATYILTASEVWFLKAEAALYNIIDGDANEYYREGITAALNQWGIDEALIEQYLASEQGNLSGTQYQQFEQIYNQLWIALLPDGFEGWTTIRRTGFPRIVIRTEPKYELGVTNGMLPRRLKYPSNEINLNNSNYLDAISKQGKDDVLTPLWWDILN